MSEHKIRGMYHTGIAYTWYECQRCGENGTTPRSFDGDCEVNDD